MSASRERNQRASDDDLLTAKQGKAAQEAAQAKRKTILYTVIGVICAILAAALLIWNSGFFQGRSTAYTADGVNYTPAEYSYYYRTIYNQYVSYGLLDSDTSLDEVYDEDSGQTYDEYFKSYTQDSLDSLTVLYRGAQEAGLSLTAEEKEEISSTIQSYRTYAAQYGYNLSSYLRAIFGTYMTQGRLEKILEKQALASDFYDQQEASFTYDQAALDDYYSENADTLDTFVHSSVFISAPEVEDDEDEEAVAAALAQAEEQANALAAELEAGGDFATLAAEYTADEESPSIYTELTVPGSMLSSLYGDWLREADRQSGDVTVMESSAGTGYFVVQFVDRYLLTDNTVDIRHILIMADVDDGADAPTDAQMAAAKEKAEELLATWQTGDATEDSFAELANANSDDSGSNTNGGFYNAYKGQMVANFNSWIFDSARKNGDVGIVENDSAGSQGYHIIYFIGTNDPYWEQQAVSSLQSSDMTDWLEAELDALVTSTGSGLKYVG